MSPILHLLPGAARQCHRAITAAGAMAQKKRAPASRKMVLTIVSEIAVILAVILVVFCTLRECVLKVQAIRDAGVNATHCDKPLTYIPRWQ
ncbi:hypothetical protein F9C28_18665 [Shimwellia pseudoproteus]|uniref:hypothetical protein n=1 Tax=Shimwellia pseudoproteus TaxID=570012 RepID=UPI0018EACB7A|nr:hypothetical protein [Shimwellia pseudoproteus]MBJ3816871.1 hypothetical protein [Shimwellia pseudoproteus]